MSAPPEPCAAPFLIIAGSYRAGSTALFEHLAAHPAIAASSVKETGYFLPYEKAPSRAGEARFETTPFPAYLQNFGLAEDDHSKVRLEATPSYLYFRQSAEWIRQALPAARIVLSLREPVSRLVSWYQTALMFRAIPQEMTFEAYVREQLPGDTPPTRGNFFYLALAHGRYTGYLRDYLGVFGPEQLLVTWFDDLAGRPNELLMEICRFAGVDEGFYRNYQVTQVNAAKKLRDWKYHARYRALKGLVSRWVRHVPPLHSILGSARQKLEPKFYEMISLPADRVEVPAALKRELHELYADDARQLQQLLGREVPWAHPAAPAKLP